MSKNQYKTDSKEPMGKSQASLTPATPTSSQRWRMTEEHLSTCPSHTRAPAHTNAHTYAKIEDAR